MEKMYNRLIVVRVNMRAINHGQSLFCIECNCHWLVILHRNIIQQLNYKQDKINL